MTGLIVLLFVGYPALTAGLSLIGRLFGQRT